MKTQVEAAVAALAATGMAVAVACVGKGSGGEWGMETRVHTSSSSVAEAPKSRVTPPGTRRCWSGSKASCTASVALRS